MTFQTFLFPVFCTIFENDIKIFQKKKVMRKYACKEVVIRKNKIPLYCLGEIFSSFFGGSGPLRKIFFADFGKIFLSKLFMIVFNVCCHTTNQMTLFSSSGHILNQILDANERSATQSLFFNSSLQHFYFQTFESNQDVYGD